MLAGGQIVPSQKISRQSRLLSKLREMHSCPTPELYYARIVRCTCFPPRYKEHGGIHSLPYLITANDQKDHEREVRVETIKTAYYSSDKVPRVVLIDSTEVNAEHKRKEIYLVTISLSGNGTVSWRDEEAGVITAMGCFPLPAQITRRIAEDEGADLWKIFEGKGGWEKERTECGFDFTGNMKAVLFGIEGSLEETASATRMLFPKPMLVPPIYPFSIPIELSTGCSKKKACGMCSLDDVEGKHLDMSTIKDHIVQWSKSIGRLVTSTHSVFLGRNCLPPPEVVLEALEFLKSDQVFENLRRGLHPQIEGYLEEKRSFWGNIGKFSAFARVSDILDSKHEDLKKLEEQGVKQLFIALETGSDRIRRYVLGKDYSTEDVEKAVRKVLEAGMRADVIVMLGVGGRKERDEHLSETVAAMSRLQEIAEGCKERSGYDRMTFFMSPLEMEYTTEFVRRRIGAVTHSDILSELSEMGKLEEGRYGTNRTVLEHDTGFILNNGIRIGIMPYSYQSLFI